MNEHEKPQIDFMHKLARQIVERRNLVFLFVILAAIFTVFSVRWVKVETDMTTYLPKTSETRMGLDIMDEQFTTYGSADVMVANITPAEADELSDRLTELKGVQMLDYDDTTDHYNKDAVSALYSITFDYPEDDDHCLEALDRVKEYLADYDIDFEALIGPMMYNSIDEYSYVCQSDLVKNMCQKLEDNYGIHVLALDFNVGMRCLQTNKVIKPPAALKGMKIRKDTADGDSDKESGFYILKHTACPAVLTENLFQDNREDVDFLLSEEGKQKITAIHVDGICKYLGV